MTDLLGPASAANSVTTRPADTRTFGASDTWAKDASTSTSNDGTQWSASTFNGLLAQVRNFIRGRNIAVDNTNDNMMLQAAQSVAPPFAADTGTAGAIVVDVNQPGFTLNPGQQIRVKLANTVPGATTLTLNNSAGPTTSFGTFNVTRGDTSTLQTYDGVTGQVVTLTYDGTHLQLEKPFLPGNTGDVKWALAGTSQTGHVPLNGLTVGNASSGATGLASALAQSLFVFHYLNFSNTLCPVSGGRSGSNQAAALADFAAGKMLQLIDTQCKTIVGVDAMGGASATNRLASVPVTAGAAATPGSTLGEALHALVTGELAAHSHGVTDLGHSHGVSDPTHNHSHNDPEHSHAANGDFLTTDANVAENTTAGGPGNVGEYSNTASNTTGVTNNAASTGVGVNSATTGISINNAGSGTAHNNTQLSVTMVAFARL